MTTPSAAEELARLRFDWATEDWKIVDVLAAGLGYDYHPLYGFPTGDHVAITMAQVAAAELTRLRAVNAGLQGYVNATIKEGSVNEFAV